MTDSVSGQQARAQYRNTNRGYRSQGYTDRPRDHSMRTHRGSGRIPRTGLALVGVGLGVPRFRG